MKNIPCLLAAISSRRMRIKSSSAQNWQWKIALEVGDVLTLTHAGLDQQDGEYIDTIQKRRLLPRWRLWAFSSVTELPTVRIPPPPEKQQIIFFPTAIC